MTGQLLLIASYPKSGNTWTRVVMQTLLQRNAPVALGDLEEHWYGLDRRISFDALAPANAADLLPDEIDELLPDVLRHWAAESAGPMIVKSHDRPRRTVSGRWLFPPDCVRSVLHLVRHPFDVAVSLAHHLGLAVDDAVRLMARSDATLALSLKELQLPLHEVTGSWSGHAEGWLGITPYTVISIRYEDLCRDPQHGFERLSAAAGLDASRHDIARAVDSARFERLRAQEERLGFRERPSSSPRFFRGGEPGSGARDLSAAHCAALCLQHGAAMRRFGYLDDGRTLPG